MKQHSKKIDAYYMQKAMCLAEKGRGRVHPNPLVGALLVKNNRVIGQGAHEVFGGPHAEVNAIRSASNNARGATLYVTLEPCAHFGKTPPCAELIVKSKIKEVVMSTKDPNPLVAGKGIGMLRRNKIKTKIGVLSGQAIELNKAYFHWIKNKRPYVIIKIAQTLDGKIATQGGLSKWITGDVARVFAHRLRAESDAIVVGINTVLKDDPKLTVRKGQKKIAPLRVILDSRLRTPRTARIFSVGKSNTVIIATTRFATAAALSKLKSKAEILCLPDKNGQVDLDKLLTVLGGRGITQVLFEGGGKVVGSLLRQGLANEIYLVLAPKIMGDKEAVSSVEGIKLTALKELIRINSLTVEKLGEDILIHGIIRKD